jgi:hypothetical protein
MARWGLQVNRHGTSFIKINFNPRVCFGITFSHSSYGPSYVKQILDGVKKFKRFNRKITRQFFTCITKLLGTQCGFVNLQKIEELCVAPSTSYCGLTAGEKRFT